VRELLDRQRDVVLEKTISFAEALAGRSVGEPEERSVRPIAAA